MPRVAVLAVTLAASWCLPAAGQEDGDTLVLSSDQAVTFALERNLALVAARLGPKAAALDVSVANVAWSPRLSTHTGIADGRVPALTVFSPSAGQVSTQVASSAVISQALLPGSSYSVEWDAERLVGNSPVVLLNPQLTTAATVSFTQHLVRGLTIDEARATRLISLKTLGVSEIELASAEAAVTYAVRRAYWSWIYVRQYLSVEQKSLELAQALLRDDRERATLGKIAAVDVIEAEAEVARRSDVILSATKDVSDAEGQLRLLIFGPSDPEQRRELISPSDADDLPLETSDTALTIARALDSRLDLRLLRASLDIDDVTIKLFRNDRLPDASLTLSYTGQGAAGNAVPVSQGSATALATGSQGFSSALGDLANLRYSGWSADLSLSVPLGRSQAAAEAAKASVKRVQDQTTLRSAQQRVTTEVKSVLRGVEANRQRLPLTSNAVTLAERRLDGEQRKFVVGLSTSFLVFQAQRDLTTARENQVKSVLDYRLSLADLGAVRYVSVHR